MLASVSSHHTADSFSAKIPKFGNSDHPSHHESSLEAKSGDIEATRVAAAAVTNLKKK